MDEFVIEGGVPLRGAITPAGNKNASLPLLAACLLSDEPVTLHNVPHIRDVLDMRDLIESVGAQVEELDTHTWRITSRTLRPADLDPDLCRRIRASILIAGPMTARGRTATAASRRGCHWPPPSRYAHSGFASPRCGSDL